MKGSYSRSGRSTSRPITMPPLRGRTRILRIRKHLKPIRQKLLGDRQHPIRRLTHEIRHRNEVAGMCIDKGFVPCCGGGVLDLDDVREGDGAVGFGEVFEGGGVGVVGALKSGFGGRDGCLDGDAWICVWDVG